MDSLKIIKEQLISQVQGQMGNLAQVDTKELGEVIDMIKDLAEATYYCTVTEAMEESKDEKKMEQMSYTPYLPYEKSYQYNPYRDMDIDQGKMYYGGPRGSQNGQDTKRGLGNGKSSRSTSIDEQPTQYPGPMTQTEIRDYREGRSPRVRKMYMESKELHHDKAKQMQELEKYMKELSKDVTEMIEDATPEEKQLLKQKMSQLVGLIA